MQGVWRVWSVACVLWSCLAVAPVQLQKAVELSKHSNWTAVKELLQGTVAAADESSDAMLLYGAALLYESRFEEAERYLRTGIEVSEFQSMPGVLNVIECYKHLRRYGDIRNVSVCACDLCGKVLTTFPSNFIALVLFLHADKEVFGAQITQQAAKVHGEHEQQLSQKLAEAALQEALEYVNTTFVSELLLNTPDTATATLSALVVSARSCLLARCSSSSNVDNLTLCSVGNL